MDSLPRRLDAKNTDEHYEIQELVRIKVPDMFLLNVRLRRSEAKKSNESVLVEVCDNILSCISGIKSEYELAEEEGRAVRSDSLDHFAIMYSEHVTELFRVLAHVVTNTEYVFYDFGRYSRPSRLNLYKEPHLR